MASLGYEPEAKNLLLIFDSIPSLIHTARPDGYLDYFNQHWLEYVGLPIESILGWKWTAAIHPEDVDAIVDRWRSSLASGEPFLHESRVRRADGEYRWMLHHKVAVRDESGKIIKWHGSSIDIEDRKRAEEAVQSMSRNLQESNVKLEEAQRITHVGYWEWDLATDRLTWSDETYRIFGLRPQERPMGVEAFQEMIYPEDREFLLRATQEARGGGGPDIEFRIVRPSGEVRIVHSRGATTRDVSGQPRHRFGTLQDITDRKRAEEALQRSEFYLAEGQRHGHMGSWAFDSAGFDYWSPELFRIHGLDPARKAPTVQEYLALLHPHDRESMANLIKGILAKASPFDATKRIVRPNGEVRYVRCVGAPVCRKRYVGSAIDVTEHELLTQELRRREAYLADAQKLSHTGSFGWRPDDGEIVWSDETYRIFEYDRGTKPVLDMVVQRVHPDDRVLAQQVIDRASQTGRDFEQEYRLLMPDGRVKHVHAIAHALQDESGNREFVGAVTDITERKKAEEKIREQESELRQVLDLAPQHSAVFGPGGERIYANRVFLDYIGLSLDEWRQTPGGFFRAGWFVHPDDRERMGSDSVSARSSGSAYELELRVRKADGSYRWFLLRYNPVRDEHGQVVRWYVASTDIDERKRAEEKLQLENAALREEIDQTSMFEEIVGTSPALQTVLSRISKVAPSDSTVLITGETGTGKELVARAIHRRSQRSGRAFVSVNCAAIPRDLIASELFGHEKGAFTGAVQRRLGRFEMANGGTIFLDEVGELSPDTQVALLRVLQEREFERVGGGQPIQVNVRVIAATNRDLQAAVANGTFRQDLFYRLNVFPIEVPPLRERKGDILILVEYFAQRYATRAGKNIRLIDKKTLDLLQSYQWPGNIRELQNVIERSVIVSETETFSIDQSWLSRQATPSYSKSNLDLAEKLAAQEKELIEAALGESGGRVYGPSGAAAKLGMPRSTLETKIRSLKINKHRFKH